MRTEFNWEGNLGAQASGDTVHDDRGFSARKIGNQYDELIPAKPGHRVTLAGYSPEPLRAGD